MGVDLSELPQDIVESISKRLTVYVDYLRFRCVCRSWNSFLPKTPLHLPPQLPWLMLSHKSFFNLSTNKIHRLNLPPRSGPTRICGSSHGWIVILEETAELTLLNPITRATISLPSLQTFPELVAMLRGYPDNNRHLINVVLSSNPSLSDDDFVAFAILNRRDFVFCKKGYNSWVLL
ncbi:F-box protein SKIP23-like, partial [Trifolium medium]|nr:F-box protein SKIP23-like [Trifolium medium]